MPIITTPRYKVITGGDAHYPFQCEKSIRGFIRLIKLEKPTHVVLTGDMGDFKSVSRWLKKPSDLGLSKELQGTRDLIMRIREVHKKKMHYVEGNHEVRLKKRILNRMPELWGVPEFNMQHLLKLKEMRVNWTPIDTNFDLQIDGIIYRHGDGRKCTVACALVRAIQRRFRQNLIVGHSHKMGVVYERAGTRDNELILGGETGCLCTADAGREYVRDPDWHHGALIIEKGRPRTVSFE